MSVLPDVLIVVGYALLAAGIVHSSIILWVLRTRTPAQTPSGGQAPVTVLKPLCGIESGLESRLRSFCRQEHPCFQLVFGVTDRRDAVLDVVARLREEFPHVDMDVIVDDRAVGQNPKVNNLCNMMTVAKYDRLILADSDILVGRDYLRTVSAPLDRDDIGLVTCLYYGAAAAGFWSCLGAQFINGWFLPSVLLAEKLGSGILAFGATIALRRDTLAAIGGFEVVADYLADDYMLGALVVQRGLRTELSSYVVNTLVAEPDLKTLWRHEIRWTRTIRALQPLGHLGSVITLGLPMAALGVLLTGGAGPAWVLFLMAMALRTLIPFFARRYVTANDGAIIKLPPLWLLPLRDLFSFCIWCASWLNTTIHWRGGRYHLRRDGTFQRVNH